MRRSWCVVILSALTSLAPSSFAGGFASPAALQAGKGMIAIEDRTWPVSGTVKTLRGDPVSHAVVTVRVTSGPAQPRTLVTNLQGEFATEFTFNTAVVTELRLDLAITKTGLQKAHEIVEFAAPDKAFEIPITLRGIQEDPELIAQAELSATLSARVRRFSAESAQSASTERDYSRGVTEFLDHNNADRALPFLSSASRRDPACVACRTVLGLAELTSGNWDGAYRDLTEAANAGRLKGGAGGTEALLTLGVMESWKHEPEAAAGFFLDALKIAPQDPLVLQELGRSQLLIRNWAAANEYLEKAIAAGAGAEARLMRVQALMGRGDTEEASKEMTRYLVGRDVKQMPVRVRQIWVQIRDRQKAETIVLAKSDVDQPIEDLVRAVPELKGIEPAKDQHLLEPVLAAVGKNVAEFFRNFQSTISSEKIHQEKLSHNGQAEESMDQTFDYLCLTPAEKWGLGFTEDRANSDGTHASPHGLERGFMLTSGFASASIVFHPVYQQDAAFRYLGQETIDGRNTFVIAYAQRPARARCTGTFKTSQGSAVMFSQGLAWVDAKNYQIVHLQAHLLAPLPEVKLEKLSTEIDFQEVRFKDAPGTFWLPREVKVGVDWNGKRLCNLHRYSDFKHFNVESTENVGERKRIGATSKEEPERKEQR